MFVSRLNSLKCNCHWIQLLFSLHSTTKQLLNDIAIFLLFKVVVEVSTSGMASGSV